jgi:hypothetical protein
MTLQMVLAVSAFVCGASAQTVVAVSDAGETGLIMRNVKNSFVDSNGRQAVSAVGTQAGSTAASVLTAPLGLAGLPIQLGIGSLSRLRQRTAKGTNIYYLSGISAEATLTKGLVSFRIDPDQSDFDRAGLKVGTPMLIRLEPSEKDLARILRKVGVACQAKTEGGTVILSPDQPLESGEYAVVLPTRQVGPGVNSPEIPAMAWDFRIPQ